MMTPTHLFHQTAVVTPYTVADSDGSTVQTAGATYNVTCRVQYQDSSEQWKNGKKSIDYDAILYCGPSTTFAKSSRVAVGSRSFDIIGIMEQGTQISVFQKKILLRERK